MSVTDIIWTCSLTLLIVVAVIIGRDRKDTEGSGDGEDKD